LPRSTQQRTQRETGRGGPSGRTHEIQRLIGRSLRAIADMKVLGERTITIDCDVLQADGGTRTASITGAFLALMMAQEKWLTTRLIDKPFIVEKISAVSVGVVAGKTLLDLNYDEDSVASADFNFVITESDKIIEMQGGAESSPLSWDTFDEVRDLARHGAQQLFAFYSASQKEQASQDGAGYSTHMREERAPLFSLKNRQHSSQ